MADCCCATRTNYFHVKDETEFRKLMEQVYVFKNSIINQGTIEIWDEKDAEGKPVFGFGAYGRILGVLPESDGEDRKEAECDLSCKVSYLDFIGALQECLADDDAIMIMEAGNEKLCCVNGQAIVITSVNHKVVHLHDFAAGVAREMLGDPEWNTKCEY